jgi:DNA-binding NarL/FixJ family response regulator
MTEATDYLRRSIERLEGLNKALNSQAIREILDDLSRVEAYLEGNPKPKRLDLRRTVPVGPQHGKAKLTEEQVLEIKRRLRDGEGYKDIAPDYDTSPGNVSNIAKGKSWAWLKLEEEKV